jgi:hypothetical protein
MQYPFVLFDLVQIAHIGDLVGLMLVVAMVGFGTAILVGTAAIRLSDAYYGGAYGRAMRRRQRSRFKETLGLYDAMQSRKRALGL